MHYRRRACFNGLFDIVVTVNMEARQSKIDIVRAGASAVVAETANFRIARSLPLNYVDIVYDC